MRKRMMAVLGMMFLVVAALVSRGYAQRGPAPTPKLADLIQAAKAEGELNLVAGGGTWGEDEGVKIIQDALNKKYSLNIKIHYAAGSSMPVMAGRVIETYKAGAKSDTDLYVGNAVSMPSILEAGVARSFPWREVFPYIPGDITEFKDQLIRSVDVFDGITYNTREIKGDNVPRRLEDVLQPQWKGKIASTPYAASLYYLAPNRVWGNEKTMAFVRALSRQIGGLIRCGEEARIASGEFLMHVMNCGNYGPDNYARKTGAPVGTIVPEDAAVMDSFYFVVPKNSAHPNLATLLVGFLMSKEGQDLIYRAVGWSSTSVEGTPADRKYKELQAKGIKIQRFTAASYMGEEGPILKKAVEETIKLLTGR